MVNRRMAPLYLGTQPQLLFAQMQIGGPPVDEAGEDFAVRTSFFPVSSVSRLSYLKLDLGGLRSLGCPDESPRRASPPPAIIAGEVP